MKENLIYLAEAKEAGADFGLVLPPAYWTKSRYTNPYPHRLEVISYARLLERGKHKIISSDLKLLTRQNFLDDIYIEQEYCHTGLFCL